MQRADVFGKETSGVDLAPFASVLGVFGWFRSVLLSISCGNSLRVPCRITGRGVGVRHLRAFSLPTTSPGRRLFPDDNWWNQDISGAPVDPQSSAYIAYIGGSRTSHPDFGPPPYGIPYIGVGGDQPRVPITFTAYGSESDSGFGGEPGYPTPPAAATQPNYIEGGVPGGGSSGDRHLLVVDRDRWLLFELFAAHWNAGAQRWEAGSGAVYNLASNARRPEGWTSADAAGLAILPGLVRYDEAVRGPIRHAVRVTVRATNGYVWPASQPAGSSSGAVPMGARLRLKASKDLSAYPANPQNLRGHADPCLIVADKAAIST